MDRDAAHALFLELRQVAAASGCSFEEVASAALEMLAECIGMLAEGGDPEPWIASAGEHIREALERNREVIAEHLQRFKSQIN